MSKPQDGELDALLAQRLVSLRQGAGWSLEDLAQRSGVSRATLSRLERSETSANATVLHRLAQAYGITMSRLLADLESRPVRRLRAAEQPRWGDAGAGFERRMCCPPMSGFATEMVEVVLAPGAQLRYEQPSVMGLEHHLYVLAGQLRLTLQGEVYEAAPGDSLSFHSLGSTEFENPGLEPLRYVLSLTPPQR